MTTRRPSSVTVEEARWLTEGGMHPALVAQALGVQAGSIAKACRAVGDEELAGIFEHEHTVAKELRRAA